MLNTIFLGGKSPTRVCMNNLQAHLTKEYEHSSRRIDDYYDENKIITNSHISSRNIFIAMCTLCFGGGQTHDSVIMNEPGGKTHTL